MGIVCVAALLLAACDDGSSFDLGGADGSDSDTNAGSAGSRTADLDVCGLLSDAEVKFLTNGIHVSVSTIDAFVTDDQLLAVTTIVVPPLGD